MKIFILGFMYFFFILAASATEPQQIPPNSPTSSSKPLPTLSTVHNLDIVLSEKVQDQLTKNKALKGEAVSAASNNQIVILQGTVSTKHQEAIAINIAKSVKGVKKVKSQLTIKKISNK